MGLTDRQAADRRKEAAAGRASQTLARHTQMNRTSPALGFRSGLIVAVRELRTELIALYANLEGADDEPLRSELAQVISDRITSFIQSSVAGVRGTDSASAVRAGMRLISSSTLGVGAALDLAVYDRKKSEPRALQLAGYALRVLFLSANPIAQHSLDVEKEQNRIIKVRNGSKFQSKIQIEGLPDLDLPEFVKSLRLHRPHVVHFSGHGSPDGALVMRDENHQEAMMAPRGLAKLLAQQKSTIQLVVLNACYSSGLADILADEIDCIVGMNDSVSDEAAILFSQTLYSAIFDGNSIGEAFDTSTASMEARYGDEKDIPLLKTKGGVDAYKVKMLF